MVTGEEDGRGRVKWMKEINSMVEKGNQAFSGDFVGHTDVKLECWTPEICILLHINFTAIKKIVLQKFNFISTFQKFNFKGRNSCFILTLGSECCLGKAVVETTTQQ